MLAILSSIIAACVVALVAYLAVRRAVSNTRALSETEARLNSRLDDVLKTAAGSGSEARTAIQEKITELYEKIEERNRVARSETQATLEQFRGTLDASRESLNKSLESTTNSLTARFEKMQESNEQKLAEIRGEVEKKLAQTQESMTQTFGSMFEHLSKLQETNQNIMQFSQEMHELQGILKAPRLRGELGEVEMERMLRDCLSPDQFAVQFEIDHGNRVDAVIFNPEGKLPIDSKFPLEAWRRMYVSDATDGDRQAARRDFIKAVKGHIDTIAQKYIRPPQTLDFAVMYVPAEGIYYELMETPELAEFARQRRVFPASPVTFWALLQVTVIGFRGLRITENARHIAQLLNALKGDLSRFREAFRVASKQIGNAKSNMDDAGEHLERFAIKLEGLDTKSLDNGQPPQLDVPAAETP